MAISPFLMVPACNNYAAIVGFMVNVKPTHILSLSLLQVQSNYVKKILFFSALISGQITALHTAC